MAQGNAEVVTIDCQYLHPRFAAAYLITEGDRAAFIDNNTAHSVPLLLEALARKGMSPGQVEYVIVTHAHLDHAGGSSLLMERCPNARLLAHPRAARHLIGPSRLVASARQVYGDAELERLYGEIRPIASDRVREMADGERLSWGSRELEFLHTQGHARHHMCILDSGSGSIFTGDSFGLRYPDLQRGGLFIFPSTSPTDFDAREARKSVRRIVSSGARSAYPTHFGEVRELREAEAQLLKHLDASERILEDAILSAEPDENLERFCEQRLRAHFAAALARVGLDSDARAWELVRLDLELNAAGLAHVARKRRSEGTTERTST